MLQNFTRVRFDRVVEPKEEIMRARLPLRLLVLVAAMSLVLSCTTDTGVTSKVKTKMLADDTVRAYQIQVETKDGVVTLTGNIDSQEAKDRALQLAKDTKGVVQVIDMIAVKTAAGNAEAPEPPRTIGQHIDDAGITMRVKTRLLEDPLVKGLKIDVDTRDGVVYLTGPVSSKAEKEKAIEIAKATEGVRDVQANLTVERNG